MKIKVYEHSGNKVKYDDDLPKAAQYIKDKTPFTLEFSVPEKTNFFLKDCPVNLYLPNEGKADMVMYVFDRKQRVNSFALNFSKTLQCMEISTATYDDAVDYTWKTIVHEILHSFFHRLRNMGINLQDPMDAMLVNGVWTPYYKNEFPYDSDSNYAEALRRLAPYWHLLAPTSPTGVRVELTRTFSDTQQTTGLIEAYNNGAKFQCRTLELAYKGNMADVSCITPGTYQVKWTFSPRLLKYTYEVVAPPRTGIRFHPANFFYDLKGCIALGDNLVDINGDGKLDVTNSRKTIKAFEDFMGRCAFKLIIN